MDNENAIARAQIIAQSGSIELVQAESGRILNTLFAQSDAGKLSDRDAAVGISTLAALRRVARSMERAVTRGTIAGEQLTKEKTRG